MTEKSLTKKQLDTSLNVFKRDIFDRMDSKFKGVAARFDKTDKRLEKIEKRLTAVEVKVDAIVEELATRKEMRNLVAELERAGVHVRATKIFVN